MANFIKPYRQDPTVGHLMTPITSSNVTKAILKHSPAYRYGTNSFIRGLEMGAIHGYIIMGPFLISGPLRNSDIGLLAGFLSTIGLVIILTLGLLIYGLATFEYTKLRNKSYFASVHSRRSWHHLTRGFFLGACGSAGFAFICLASIPTFIK